MIGQHYTLQLVIQRDFRFLNFNNMKRGFTLIETIIYISLLSIILTGIFLSLFGFLHSRINDRGISESDYELLISNFHE